MITPPKIQVLILVMWERLMKCGEINGMYPYSGDPEFCEILKGCQIDPNELDVFLETNYLEYKGEKNENKG